MNKSDPRHFVLDAKNYELLCERLFVLETDRSVRKLNGKSESEQNSLLVDVSSVSHIYDEKQQKSSRFSCSEKQ